MNQKYLCGVFIALQVVVILSSLLVYFLYVDNNDSRFALMIDARAEKTTIAVYSWSSTQQSRDIGTPEIKLFFNDSMKEGLTMDNNPKKYGRSLRPFIANARSQIERLYYHSTLFSFGVSSESLRISNNYERFLYLVMTEIQGEMDFYNANMSVVTGKTITLWLTINSLRNTLKPGSLKRANPQTTIGVINIDELSASIAYEVRNQSNGSLTDIELYGHHHSVYSEEAYCFGMKHFKLRLMLILKDDSLKNNEDPCLPVGVKRTYFGYEFLKNPCLHGKRVAALRDEQVYVFQGTADPRKCSQIIKDALNVTKCKSHFDHCFEGNDNEISNEMKFVATSQYYTSTRMLRFEEKVPKKDAFLLQTNRICQLSVEELMQLQSVIASNYDKVCYKLYYIYELLNTAYKFEDFTLIEFSDKINGETIDWKRGEAIKQSIQYHNLIPKPKATHLLPIYGLWFVLIVTTLLLVTSLIGCFHKRNNE